jgi:hypothetical protein
VGASDLVASTAGRDALRPQGYQINAALTEAIFVGLMRRLDHGSAPDPAKVQTAIDEIRSDERMQSVVSRATADEESVRKRLEVATASLARA